MILILKTILILTIIQWTNAQTSFVVSTNTLFVNANAEYTWTITFATNVPKTYMRLVFIPEIKLSVLTAGSVNSVVLGSPIVGANYI
jgi:hypothetical protein